MASPCASHVWETLPNDSRICFECNIRLDADQWDAFEERASIMQFDGGLPKEQAEAAAMVRTLGPQAAQGALL